MRAIRVSSPLADLVPAVPIEFDIGRRLHTVADEIVTADLRNQLFRLCGPHWWACLIRSGGKGLFRPSHELMDAIDEERRLYAIALTTKLNAYLANGGHWVVAWVPSARSVVNDPAKRAEGIKWVWSALWRDMDGDVQFTVECTEPWVRMRRDGVDPHVESAAQAFAQWIEHKKHVLGISDSQTFRQAQGEAPPST